MKKLIFRSGLLLAFYLVLLILDGCDRNPCGCPDHTPSLYDYSTAVLFDNSYRNPSGELNASLEVHGLEMEFFAGSCTSTGGFGALYACTCPERGWQGMQFPITHIDIYSQDNFNDSLPAGTALNSVFMVSAEGTPQALNHDTLNPTIYDALLFYPVVIPEDSNATQHVWVEITKSNGEVVITNDVLIEEWE